MKKLLIWDGDNSLWDGIMLEGSDVQLPAGRYDLCAELCNRGILQSVASANRMEDVLSAITKFDLGNFFLYPQADWGPKSLMLHKIKDALGLARWEDIVFVDDERSNRAEAEEICPGLIAVHPFDIERTVGLYFTQESYTDEDRQRVRQYKAEQVRANASTEYTGDYQTFLRSCNLRLHLTPLTLSTLPRAISLIERSNRFSATEPHVTEDYLLDCLRGKQRHIVPIVGHVTDKFGDYGLSAVMILDLNIGRLSTLVVSCRLQGKGIGSALVGFAINTFHIWQAKWIRTEFNTAVDELFNWYDFRIDTPSPSTAVAVRKSDQERVNTPDWIIISATGSLLQ